MNEANKARCSDDMDVMRNGTCPVIETPPPNDLNRMSSNESQTTQIAKLNVTDEEGAAGDKFPSLCNGHESREEHKNTINAVSQCNSVINKNDMEHSPEGSVTERMQDSPGPEGCSTSVIGQ